MLLKALEDREGFAFQYSCESHREAVADHAPNPGPCGGIFLARLALKETVTNSSGHFCNGSSYGPELGSPGWNMSCRLQSVPRKSHASSLEPGASKKDANHALFSGEEAGSIFQLGSAEEWHSCTALLARVRAVATTAHSLKLKAVDARASGA